MITTLIGMAALVCAAQWERVHLEDPLLGGSWDENEELGNGTMTEAGIGFWTRRTYFSPSSGHSSVVFFTSSDWLDAEAVAYSGSGIGCCTIDVVGSFSPNTVFYRHNNQGAYQLHSLTRAGDVFVDRTYQYMPVFQGYFSEVCGVSDTVCILTYGSKIARVTPNTRQELDTLQNADGSIVRLAFLDNDIGAMLCDLVGAGCEVRVTTNGGEDWSVALSDSLHFFRDVSWVDANTMWVVGDDGWTVRTTDGGLTWEAAPIVTTPDLLTVAAYSADSLWVGGMEGAVYATGNAGLEWSDLSLPDSMVVDLQAFEGAMYAATRFWNPFIYAGAHLYEYRKAPQDLTRLGTRDWWSFAASGIALRLNEGEDIGSIEMMDASGRMIGATISGQTIFMEHLRAGMYLVKLQSDQRTSIAKVIWPGRQ